MNIQNRNISYYTLYWAVCGVLFIIALLIQVTLPWYSANLYPIALYILFGLGAGLYLRFYQQKCLVDYMKEHHPQIWEQIVADTSKQYQRFYRFAFARKRVDDPLLEQQRRRYQVAYITPLIHTMAFIILMYFFLGLHQAIL